MSLNKQQFVVIHTLPQIDACIQRQLGYKHTFCQNVFSTKQNCFSLYIRKKNMFIFGLETICQVFFPSSKIVYLWRTKKSCFMAEVLSLISVDFKIEGGTADGGTVVNVLRYKSEGR
jgi:hypothetical protein